MDEATNIPAQSLQEYSRQPIVHTPAAKMQAFDPNLVRLGAELRQADALERIAAALEIANEQQQPQMLSAALDVQPGRTMVHASKEHDGKQVNVSLEFSTPFGAANFFANFSDHMKAVVDKANELKGGLGDD